MGTRLDTATAVEISVGERPRCWGIAQSLESRYGAAESTASIARILGGWILATRGQQVRPPDAAPLPRLFVIAVTASAVHFFDPPMRAPRPPIASCPLAGAVVEVHGGMFWTRVVLRGGNPARSYVAYFSRIAKGRREVIEALGPLTVTA